MIHHYLARHADRRRAIRRVVEREARIRFPGGLFLPAIVRDISPFGAGLELTADAVLPLRFRLQIAQDVFEVDCDLKYQRGRCVGVQFASHRTEALARYR